MAGYAFPHWQESVEITNATIIIISSKHLAHETKSMGAHLMCAASENEETKNNHIKRKQHENNNDIKLFFF